MKILYQCDICKTNYSTEELVLKCEAQPYLKPLLDGTQVSYHGEVCRVGVFVIDIRHEHNYLLSRLSEDNGGESPDCSMGFVHESEFVEMDVNIATN
jgi:hypothetical protein